MLHGTHSILLIGHIHKELTDCSSLITEISDDLFSEDFCCCLVPTR